MKHEVGDLSLDEGWHESEDGLELSSSNMDMITIISYDQHHTCDLMTMITSSQVCGGDVDNIHQHPHNRRLDHREDGRS